MSRIYVFSAVAIGSFAVSTAWSYAFHRDALLALLSGRTRLTRVESDDAYWQAIRTQALPSRPKPMAEGHDPSKRHTNENGEGDAAQVTGEEVSQTIPASSPDSGVEACPLTKEIRTAERVAMGMSVQTDNLHTSRPYVGSEHPDEMPFDGSIKRSNHGVEVISRLYEVDKIYRSMQGPWSENRVPFLDQATPELIWITGVKVDMVGEDGRSPMPELFMCHANFDIDLSGHQERFGINQRNFDERLFTLSQGQLEVKFPEGFGFPIMSDESIRLITQALNLNFDHRKFNVRHRVKIDFVRDQDAPRGSMKPLFEASSSSLITLENEEQVYDYLASGNISKSGPIRSMCMPGKKANDWDEHQDANGHRFTGHWVVPPGEHVNRTRVTSMLRLPFDTTAHYIAVHLHPFAESLELYDLTERKTVFKSKARNHDDLIGLAEVEYFSSEEGLMLYKDHEYEQISHYYNPTKTDSDSMAVLYVYMLDKEFSREKIAGATLTSAADTATSTGSEEPLADIRQ